MLEAYRQATGLTTSCHLVLTLAMPSDCGWTHSDLAPRDPGVVAMLSDGDALAAYLPKQFKEDGRRIQLCGSSAFK